MRSSASLNVRRSFVLIAVLVIVGSALLVATALLFVAQTQAMSSAVAADLASARALAWSGLQAVTSRLNDQRELILAGRLPELEPQYTIYETANRQGVVRLLPTGTAGERLVAEAGRLDLNSADADALVRTGLIDPATAKAIIAHRDAAYGGRFQSVVDLLSVPRGVVTPQMLFGSLDQHGMTDVFAADATLGLADVLTVFSVEPALQQSGKRRINLNTPWSDELGRRIEERFGPEAAAIVKQIFESGTTFESEAKIFQTLRFFKTPPEQWPPLVDAFTTDEGEYHFGRLDINSAPPQALQALPGITPDQASQIADLRDELSPAERATIAWLATTQIVAPEAYDQLAGKITTRCWTYRVRLATGEVSVNDPEGPLVNRLVYEAVIDLSSPKPRIAYLRDVTLLEQTVGVAVSEQSRRGELESLEDAALDLEPAEVDGAAEAPATAPASPPSSGGSANRATRPAASTDPQPQSRRRIGRWRPG